MEKKHNGWKIALIIVGSLILLAFFLWLMWPEDDWYDDWDDDSSGYGYDNRESRPQNESRSENSRTPMTFDDVVRDKLVKLKGNGKDKVTVLVYMNGSDLESDGGAATTDLGEMIAAGSSDKVNVLVETLGTKKWSSKYGISSKTAQRYKVSGSGLQLVQDKVGSVNCGSPSGLTDFIQWGVKNYPADRYILIFWNHGGGPVYGFGYDDRTESEDSLTVAEMQKALRDAGTVFDFIGMDCCIMSGIEVGCALYDFCDYMILSEDFESGDGWSYTGWLKALYANSSISTPDLGKIIVDNMVSSCSKQGDDAILTVIDESYMKLLYSSWVNFAYANEDTLLGTNYSRKKQRKAGYRVSPILELNGYFTEQPERDFWDFLFGGDDDVDMSEYYVTDIMAVASNIKSDESDALEAALNYAIVYSKACGSSANLTGFSVTLPYGDTEFYNEMKNVFLDAGFDSSYVNWLSGFASSDKSDNFYNYEKWDNDWGGWDDYEDDYDWDDYDWDDDDDWWDWGWSDWWF